MPEERAQHLAWLIAQNEGKAVTVGKSVIHQEIYAGWWFGTFFFSIIPSGKLT